MTNEEEIALLLSSAIPIDDVYGKIDQVRRIHLHG